MFGHFGNLGKFEFSGSFFNDINHMNNNNDNNNDNNTNLREFACLTTVILAPLRVEASLRGRSATSV